MPEHQIIRIEPENARLRLDFRELWNYRELLYFLTWRDVKVRYKQTAIGILWVILQPLLTTAIFTIIFTHFARFETLQVPYPLFALSGLLIWLFMHFSITMATNSLVSNASLVTKVYFPRIIIPTASVLGGLLDLILGFLILFAMMFYYGINITWKILLAPLFVLEAIVLTISFSIFLSMLNVRFRDVKFALPFFLQIWMFVSPIFYPLDVFPENWRILFYFNPLSGILEGLRSSLFGQNFDLVGISISTLLIVFLLIMSTLFFKWMESEIADLI
ncbi:MAG: ABC transporter permease [Acidobacteria bacterium]|jgi:lipopolysaccharide transport system permease protein|nr:MAG: ABC transporter permease [Acidobacteriota bacterium]GIU82835.1 MAG: transport permease protein [Pyrinomonadaceae bacterium]